MGAAEHTYDREPDVRTSEARKRVDYDTPVGSTIRRCCPRVSGYRVTRAVRFDAGEVVEYGLVLESPACACLSRWIKHDWSSLGMPEFVTI